MDHQLVLYARDLWDAGRSRDEIARELVARGADVSEAATMVEGLPDRDAKKRLAGAALRYAICIPVMLVLAASGVTIAIFLPTGPRARTIICLGCFALAGALLQFARGKLFESD